jgi:hypothetical protein
MALFGRDRNQSTDVLDRTHDNCADCGTSIPAGDVLCRSCE